MSKELLLEHLRKNSGKKEDETWFELAKKIWNRNKFQVC